ncbi:hypothetical protein ACX5DZ_003579 [Enterobacter hormaechei]
MKIKMSSVSIDTVSMFLRGATGDAQLKCLSCGAVSNVEVSSITSDSKCHQCGGVKASFEYPAPQQEVK